MTISFKSLGLSDARVEHLEKLGFITPTAIQAESIPQLLQGRDVVGQSQTGTGKTAAYSLPILEQLDLQIGAVQSLILAPTRELAQQIAQAMTDFAGNRHLQVVTVCGGQSMERQIRSLERGAQVVVGTPGRIIDLLERRKLKLEQVRWVVLDEADEMLSMGFIDDVKRFWKKHPFSVRPSVFPLLCPKPSRNLCSSFCGLLL